MLRMLSGGESHGSKIVGILEGFPSGLKVDIRNMSKMLKRRQGGYGRGKRMDMENDVPEITGGTYNGVTTGAPIVVEIKNRAGNPVKKERYTPRPGHADYVGYLKYEHEDMNITTERSSARETAIRTAMGALCKQLLTELGIEVFGFVNSIGSVFLDRKYYEIENLEDEIERSPVYCPDHRISEQMVELIEDTQSRGETLGGSFTIVAKGLPAGIGSYVQWDRRLDASISFALISIPSVKGVLIGDILETYVGYGSFSHDRFFAKNGRILRSSNHAGGIEGGVSNGEDIVVTALLKPIPTVLSLRESVDVRTLRQEKLDYIRSDTVVVPAASVVGEAMVSFVLLDHILQRYGGDTVTELKRRVSV